MSIQSLVVAVALLASPLVAAIPNSCRPVQSFEQGHELKQSQLSAGYNASARIEVRGSWDVYTAVNGLYWQPLEDNLDLGIFSTSSTNQLPITGGDVIGMDFDYSPGFQAVFGICLGHQACAIIGNRHCDGKGL